MVSLGGETAFRDQGIAGRVSPPREGHMEICKNRTQREYGGMYYPFHHPRVGVKRRPHFLQTPAIRKADVAIRQTGQR